MTVQSPCNGVCRLDDEDVCAGCGRTLDEIGAWGVVDDAGKRGIVRASAARLAAGRGDPALPS